jgi:hypothetical protein
MAIYLASVVACRVEFAANNRSPLHARRSPIHGAQFAPISLPEALDLLLVRPLLIGIDLRDREVLTGRGLRERSLLGAGG